MWAFLFPPTRNLTLILQQSGSHVVPNSQQLTKTLLYNIMLLNKPCHKLNSEEINMKKIIIFGMIVLISITAVFSLDFPSHALNQPSIIPIIAGTALLLFLMLITFFVKNRTYTIAVNGKKKKLIIKNWKTLKYDKGSTNLGSSEDLKVLYSVYPKIVKRCPIVAVKDWVIGGNFIFLSSNGTFDTAFLSNEVNKRKFRYLMVVE
jgi:hypothetical protein